MVVGKSDGRTPGKHWLLDKLFGAFTGASCKMIMSRQMLKLPIVYLDLCAGDGVATEESGMCSPGIIWKHATWFRGRLGENSAIIILIEKDRATYDILRQSYDQPGTFIIHGDSASEDVINQVKEILFPRISPASPILIHHDPNSVTNWCLTENYLSLSRYATAMLTMGCNVSGIKRLPLSERKVWYENFAVLTNYVDATNGRLDICLSALKKDSSNWAYAVVAPSRWREKVESTAKSAFKSWPSGIDIEWMTDNPSFNVLVNRLFLTKKEFEENGGLDDVA